MLGLAFFLATAATPTHVIPVEVYRNAMWVQVRVNGSRPLTAIFDSAAGRSVVARPVANELGLTIIEQGAAPNATPSATPVHVGASPNIRFDLGGGAEFTNHAAVLDMAVPDSVWGRRFEAVIGNELLARYVVETDWQKREIRLYEPAAYQYNGTGAVLPIRRAGVAPKIPVRVAMADMEPIDAWMLIDSAASSTLGFNAPFTRDHDLVGKLDARIAGESIGAGGGSPSITGRIGYIELAGVRVPGPIASFSTADAGSLSTRQWDGLIGCNLLRHFKIIYDLSRDRVIFEPSASPERTPEPSDSAGLRIRARGADLREYYVYSVVPSSPAAAAGLQKNDVLRAVDKRPAASLTMEEITRLFRTPGAKVTLTIERAGKQRENTLTLQPLL